MEDNRLYTLQRRNEILRILREQGSISVNQLAEQFQVSGTTIRLDLTALEKTGVISRTHGGAMLSGNTEREPLILERKNKAEKERIAAKAVTLISENDTILIDTGTTMHALAGALAASSLTHLRVYSNDLDVLRILEEKESFELHLMGGVIRNGFHYTAGNQVIAELSNYHFGKMFLATSAISLESGLTTANSDLAAIKAAMIAASEQVILLTDSSKMHHVLFQRFADLEAIDTLITDSGLAGEDAAALGARIRSVAMV